MVSFIFPPSLKRCGAFVSNARDRAGMVAARPKTKKSSVPLTVKRNKPLDNCESTFYHTKAVGALFVHSRLQRQFCAEHHFHIGLRWSSRLGLGAHHFFPTLKVKIKKPWIVHALQRESLSTGSVLRDCSTPNPARFLLKCWSSRNGSVLSARLVVRYCGESNLISLIELLFFWHVYLRLSFEGGHRL